ncbi:phosphonate ABC transporter substrate-binding protein [Neisseriaceae bacterium TC5R-5]|nr:phosphonate ABC transporter substrate-binding protein [Neisseriaceae bacterium TC5R-5]
MMLKKIGALLTLSLSLSGTLLAEEINFGLISTEASQNLKQDWQPLFDDLQRQTGLQVKPFFASDYAGIIEGMRFNKVQVAWLGNKSAIEAVDRAKAEVFAQMVNADGSQGYYSHLIVNRDSPINSLSDVLKNGKNLSFGNGDPNSTSGYLVPAYYVFAKNKIDAKTFFKLSRSGNHEANSLSVANKQVDVATTNSETLDKLRQRAPDKFNNIKVVWTSPLIPLDPLVMSKNLPAATQNKIKNFFYHYGKNPQEKAVLMKLNKLSGFKASDNRQLIPTRQLELFSQRNKLENDNSLNAADKKARLADIDKKLASLH